MKYTYKFRWGFFFKRFIALYGYPTLAIIIIMSVWAWVGNILKLTYPNNPVLLSLVISMLIILPALGLAISEATVRKKVK
jgi:hypothetical protein